VFIMRVLPASLLVALLLAVTGTPARAFTDAELIDGFDRTVFGSEFPTWGFQSYRVKKFAGPVRFHVDDRSRSGRRGAALSFIRSLPHRIGGLQVTIVDDPKDANFRVFIVDRSDYRQVVAGEVYGQTSTSFAPGRCVVRVVSGRGGIKRSDAVIVADEGDFLFRRCLVEEVLQGLGPANDDATLSYSVFNDRSVHSTFTSFDRFILDMLYDPRVRPGMRRAEANNVLPAVLADIRKRRSPERLR
jgi:hypothetical protein